MARIRGSRPGLGRVGPLALMALTLTASAQARGPKAPAPLTAALQSAARSDPGSGRKVRLLLRLRDPALAPEAVVATGATWSELDAEERTELRRHAATRAARGLVDELGRELPLIWAANTAVAHVTPEEALRLMERPDVEQVIPDVTLRALPPRGEIEAAIAEAPRAPGRSWGLTSSGALAAQKQHGLTGKGVVVGHIDTGVDASHPHFRGRIARFRDFLSGKPRPYDDHGHGTHTLGIMVGGGPGGSVAPDARAVVARALDAKGEGKLSALLQAMQWMLDPDGNPATRDRPFVVNASWGVTRSDMKNAGVDDRLFWDTVTAWREAGIVPVFSSGNEGASVEVIPGGYPHAMAVGAVTQSHRVPTFSSGAVLDWGGERFMKPDLGAPGLSIVSAALGGGYRKAQGTSQAAPHVAGIAALMHEANPRMRAEDVEIAIMDTVLDRGPQGRDTRFGEGVLQGAQAVARAVGSRRTPPATRPAPPTPPVPPPATRPPPPTTRPTPPRPPPATREPIRPPIRKPVMRPVPPERTEGVKRRVASIATGLAALLGLGWLLFR